MIFIMNFITKSLLIWLFGLKGLLECLVEAKGPGNHTVEFPLLQNIQILGIAH